MTDPKHDYADKLRCVCAGCEKTFTLTAETEVPGKSTYIRISSCDSGGIYAVDIRCPICGFTHDLH